MPAAMPLHLMSVAVMLAVSSGNPHHARADNALRAPLMEVREVKNRVEAFLRRHRLDPGRYSLESCQYDYITGEWNLLMVTRDATFDSIHVLLTRRPNMSYSEP